MRVLTVQQPWAWAIFNGKDVENRTQAWTYRGPLAIHAGARISQRGMESSLVGMAARRLGYHSHAPDLPLGAIIGVVDMVDVHHAAPEEYAFKDTYSAACCKSPWAEQEYVEHGGRTRRQLVHLVLQDPRPLPDPIPCRGRLGLWTPDGELLERIVDQLAVAS